MEILGETAAFSAALLIMLVGLVGVILPVVPGLVLIWLGALGFAIVEKFATLGPLALVLLSVMTIVGVTAEVWMSQLGAKIGGASLRAQLVGLAGGLVGALIFLLIGGLSAPIGAVLGSIAGVFGAEWVRLKEWKKAFRAGSGWLLGWLASMLFQFVIGGLMIVVFLWHVFRV